MCAKHLEFSVIFFILGIKPWISASLPDTSSFSTLPFSSYVIFLITTGIVIPVEYISFTIFTYLCVSWNCWINVSTPLTLTITAWKPAERTTASTVSPTFTNASFWCLLVLKLYVSILRSASFREAKIAYSPSNLPVTCVITKGISRPSNFDIIWFSLLILSSISSIVE